MHAYRCRSGVDLVEEVSRNLRPAPRIQQAADAIVATLTAGGTAFNGIHLRLEQDAGFKNMVGGEEARAIQGNPKHRLNPHPSMTPYPLPYY